MKTTATIFFIIMVIAQIFVPSKMVLDQEEILDSGKAFKFKLQPIDPNDPFRGKYIILNFEADQFYIQEEPNDWNYGDPVFVEIENDSAGFVQIMGIFKEEPAADIDFVKAKIRSAYKSRSANNSDLSQIRIDYPFDIFYMEENKAPVAETKFREMRRDSNTIAWANVKILNGNALVEDVLIDRKSVQDILKE